MSIFDYIKEKSRREVDLGRQALERAKAMTQRYIPKIQPEQVAKKVFLNTSVFGGAHKLMNDPRSPLANYFKPTANVRARDIIRELPNATFEGIKQFPQYATRFAISAGEVPNALKTGQATGKFYNTPFGRLNSFQSEAQNRTRRGDPLWKAIGNPALETLAGAGDISVALKALLGATSATKTLPQGIRNIASDFNTPATRNIQVPGYKIITHEPVEGVFSGGQPTMRQLPEPIKIPTTINKTVVNEFKSKLLNDLKNKAGLNIKDINKKGNKSQPQGITPEEITRVGNNILKNNPGITRRDAEAMAKNVIENREFNKPQGITPKVPLTSKVEAPISGQSQMPTPKGLETPPTTGTNDSKVSSFYNINKLKISTKAKKGIQDEISNAGKQLEQTVGKTLSNKEVLDIADTSGRVLDTTIGREKTAEKIASNLNLRRKIAQVAKDGKLDENFIDLWIKDKSAGEDIARQLQARSIVADPEEAKAINAVLDAIYKQNKNADEIVKASKGVDFNNQEQVTKFYRQFVKPKVSDWVDVIRYNSMLSSPNTHLVNTSSNLQGTAIITPIEKTLSGMFDAIRSGWTGGKRTQFAGEGKEYLKGYVSSVEEAAQNFMDVIRGNRMNLNPDVRNIPLTQKGTLGRGVENTLNVATRFLEGADQFFSALTKGGVKKALTYRAGKLGKPVADIEAKAAQEASQRLFRATENADQGHVLGMIDGITNSLMRARNSDNIYLKTLAKFTFPFVRTPTNIFKQGIEYSPLGIATLHGAANKTEQLAKIAIGTASATAAAMLLGEDRLTWGEPINAKRKAEFRAAGRQPYSIKIGDNWVSYAKLHPAIAFNLALVSAVDDSIKNGKLDEDTADTVLNSFAKFGKFMADQSYAKNMGDILAAVQGDSERFTSYFANYGQQMIPFRALMGWVTRIVDPVQRKIDTDGSLLDKQMQQLMMNIPGLSQKVPARTDQFGGEIPNQHRLLNAFSPNRVTTERPQYEQFYQNSLQTSKENAIKAQIKKQFEQGKIPETADKKMQVEIKRLQTLKNKENLQNDLASGDMTVDKYPKGTLTTTMVNNLYDNGDIDTATKYQLDSRLRKEKKVENSQFIKDLLAKKDFSVVKGMIKDGVLTSSAVDDMVETQTIPPKQAYALQMYLYKQRIASGEIQKPSTATFRKTQQKWAARYGLNKKQPKPIPQPVARQPFYVP
jgi:hypothetical protein